MVEAVMRDAEGGLERHFNEAGRCRALWVDIQAAREIPDPAPAFRTILGWFDRILPRRHPALPRPDPAAIDELLRDPRTAILRYLTRLSEASDRPWCSCSTRRTGWSATETEADALDQLARYLDHAGLAEGWLVRFDLPKEQPWSEKLTLRDVDHAGKRIHLVGC